MGNKRRDERARRVTVPDWAAFRKSELQCGSDSHFEAVALAGRSCSWIDDREREWDGRQGLFAEQDGAGTADLRCSLRGQAAKLHLKP